MCYQLVDGQNKVRTDNSVEPAAETQVSEQVEVLKELGKIDDENKRFLNTLEAGDSLVINHISAMNSRLSQLSKQIIHTLDADFSELMDVDISGGGLQFESDEPLNVGQQIKLELILAPKYISMMLFAQVVDSSPLAERDGYRVAIEFIEISESDRDAIIGHIFKTQSKMLRASKKSEK